MTASAPQAIGLRDVTARAHAAVGDHLAVLARLEHVLRAGGRDVRDRGRLRDADAEHAAGGAGRAGADADEHARRAGAHEVQPGRVAGAAAEDHGDRDLAHELLEVEDVTLRGDVLGGDHRALDDEDVEPGLERDLVPLLDLLRGQRRRGDDAVGLDLLDPLGDQLRLDRLGVDLLHLARRVFAVERRDPLELRVRVLIAGPDALEVEHREAAEAAEDAGGLRARPRRPSPTRAAAARSGRARAST